MSDKFYETGTYVKLEKEWNHKLKQSGFNDIEKPSRKNSDVIEPEVFEFDDRKAVHFEQCFNLLINGRFKDQLDKVILEHYCNGNSSPEILRLIKAEGWGKVTSSRTIERRIKRMLDEANIPPLYEKESG